MNRKIIAFGILSAGFITSYNTFPSFQKAKADVHDGFKITQKWNPKWDTPRDSTDGKSGKATRHLIFIRHGQYNKEDKDEDCTLTLIGSVQAEYVGKRLNELDENYTKLVHSSMTRAKQTANIILKQLDKKPLEIVCEQELEEGYPAFPDPRIPDSKILQSWVIEDNARLEKMYKKYFHRASPTQKRDSYEIFVGHANVIRYFVCRALQITPEAWIRFALDHCSITWIAIKPNGNVSIKTVGNSGFIHPNYVTNL